MTELATDLDGQAREGTVPEPATTVTPPTPPTLITEREVLVGSAAALAGPKVRTSWLRTATRALFTTAEKPKPRRHYPRHHDYIEDALMSRMMDRL